MSRKQSAFTLLELSIVIVIIGFIVAGISAGQSLVRQAQLRSVISEVNNYETAVNSFFLSYDGLPGDLINANSYWSATASGDGDRMVEWMTEAVDAWQQLSLADLVDGEYTGVETYDPGGTLPLSSLAGAGFYMHNALLSDSSDGFFAPSNLVLIFGAPDSGNAAGASYLPIITTSEARALDLKTDEGLPFTGKVRIRASNATTCADGLYGGAVNAAQVAANTYNLDAAGNLCNLIFKIR